MRNVLITGGSGFFGEILKKQLLNNGFRCVNIDIEEELFCHQPLSSVPDVFAFLP